MIDGVAWAAADRFARSERTMCVGWMRKRQQQPLRLIYLVLVYVVL